MMPHKPPPVASLFVQYWERLFRDTHSPDMHRQDIHSQDTHFRERLSRHRRLPVLLVGCLLLATGCQATEQIRGAGGNPEAIAEIEEQSQGQEATLTLVTGDERPVKAVTVGADTVYWTDAATSTAHATPRTCVEQVRFERHDKGFLQGLGIGTGSGLVGGGGAIAGFSAAGQCEGLAALACGLLGVAVLTTGTVAGSTTGAILGHDDIYVIQPTSRDACPHTADN
jgi:hypothetical protein